MPRPLLLALTALVLFSGCTSSRPLQHPGFAEADVPQRLVLLDPDVRMYELGLGMSEEMDAWSASAYAHVNEALTQYLADASIEFTRLDLEGLSDEQEANYLETRALYDAVTASLLQHTYGEDPQRFEEQRQTFDFTLGEEVRGLDPTADAYLVVWGRDEKSSGARVGAQVGAMVVGALLGVGITPVPTVTALSAALIDAQTGQVLWHHLEAEDYADLRDASDVQQLVAKVLQELPARTTTPTASR